MFGFLFIYFIFFIRNKNIFSNKNKNKLLLTTKSGLEKTNNVTHNNTQIQAFIERLKLHTFEDDDEDEIWDDGEVDWEL
jgi:hypothetical protein